MTQVPHHEEAHANSHGNTPGAWTGVVLGLVGFTVGGVGLMFDPAKFVLFWIGVAITLVGLVAYFVVDRMGA